jgi:hypothetical protein
MSIIYINPFQFAAAYDADAQDYINRVIAADVAAGNTSGLEVGVQEAINDFVVGCKNDGIWSAIKASCILAGARTLAGALVPLVGTAPTKYGTEGGWNYNRKTGLQGNGINNYLDSNRATNADPQNNSHIAVYLSTVQSSTHYIGVNFGVRTRLGNGGVTHFSSSRGDTSFLDSIGLRLGFLGNSRNASSSYTARSSGSVFNFNQTSSIPEGINYYVFASNNNGPGTAFTTSVIPFYSIGESLDLAALDTRVSTLMSDLAAAIP